jgi:hypothetical protein
MDCDFAAAVEEALVEHGGLEVQTPWITAVTSWRPRRWSDLFCCFADVYLSTMLEKTQCSQIAACFSLFLPYTHVARAFYSRYFVTSVERLW